MNKRILSVILSAALLLGAVAATGVLSAVAITDGWKAGDTDKGQYRNFARYADLSTVVEGTSLIRGMIPKGMWSIADDRAWTQYSGQTGAIDKMTDGAVGSTANDRAVIKGSTSTSRILYFDLGAKYDLTDFIVASSQSDGGANGLKNVKIYVGDALNALFTDSYLVYAQMDYDPKTENTVGGTENTNGNNSKWQYSVNFHIQPTDASGNATTVTGQYVGFELKSNSNDTSNPMIRIGELAVYGTKVLPQWKDGDDNTGRYLELEQYADISALGDNWLTGKTATGSVFSKSEWTVSDRSQDTAVGVGDMAYLADGSVGAALSDTQTVKQHVILRDGNTSTSRYVYFDLGKTVNITDFLVASSQYDAAHRLKNVKIYVAEKDPAYGDWITPRDGVVNNYTLVYSNWGYTGGAYNFRIQPTDADGVATTVTARYVCFELNTSVVNYGNRIGELGVYGTEGQTVIDPEPEGVDVWHTGEAIPTEGNLLTAATPERNTTGFSNINTKVNPDGWDDALAAMTDGDAATKAAVFAAQYEAGYPEVTDPVTGAVLEGTSGWSKSVFHLGGTYAVDKVMLIGSPTDSSASTWSYTTQAGAEQCFGDKYMMYNNGYYAANADGTMRRFNDKYLLYYEVYVGHSSATLFDADNLVLKYNNAETLYQGATYTLSESRVGCYVGFRINTSEKYQTRIGELGVYGTAVEDIKVVTVGDSITYGAHLVKGRHLKNYPALLAAKLNENATVPYSVVNVGISGSTVVNYQLVDNTAENDASWLTQGTANGYVQWADVLTIMLGTNDAMSWDARKHLYKEEYKKLVAAYRAINPDLKLYIATSPYAADSRYKNATMVEIATMQKELAAELDATLIDVFAETKHLVQTQGKEALFCTTDDSPDLLHPDEEGQAFLAELFYAHLTGTAATDENRWTDGDPVSSEGNLLAQATVDTDRSSNANPNWTGAKAALTDGNAVNKGSVYTMDDTAGYPDATVPGTGEVITGTTGWAQMAFKLDGYYTIDKLQFIGSPGDGMSNTWRINATDADGNSRESIAQQRWGENYKEQDGYYYATNADGSIRTFDDNHLLYYEVYVTDMPGMLFDKESLVLQFDNTESLYMGYTHVLDIPAEGSYVGIRVTAGSGGQARIGELGIYGQKTQRPDTGFIPWGVGDAIDTENNLLTSAERVRDNALGVAIASNLGDNAADNVRDGTATVKGTYYLFDDDVTGKFQEVTNPATGEKITGTSGWARVAFKLDRYSSIESVMLLGSPRDSQSTMWGYQYEGYALSTFGEGNYAYREKDGNYYAIYDDGTYRTFNNRHLLYYEVYVSGDADTLFNPENKVLEYDNSRALYDGGIHTLATPAEGRYVGFRVTGGSVNQARIGELGVYGHTVDKDLTFTADTAIGQVSLTVSANSTADRDALRQVLGSLRVTTEKLDSSIATDIENNWLSVDGSTVYHIQLLDKNGKVFPDTAKGSTAGLNGRAVQIRMPSTQKHMQVFGRLEDGVIQRVFNSYEGLDGLVVAGSLEYPEYGSSVVNNRDKAVITTGDLRLVFLRFNDLDTINKLSGTVINTPLSEFEPVKVAGAAEEKAVPNVLPVAAVAAVAVALATVAVVLLARRKSRLQ